VKEGELLHEFEVQNIKAGIDTCRSMRKAMKKLIHRVEETTTLKVLESKSIYIDRVWRNKLNVPAYVFITHE